MTDFLKGYDIQYWLESTAQGYLENTEYGHLAGEREPDLLMEEDTFREESISTTVQLVMGERCALAASSGLINAAPDEASKRFLATQTLDEARHVEVFTQRLYDLGVKQNELEDVLNDRVDPNLVKFAEALLEKVDKKDFVAGVVGQNIVLEGMAFCVFEMLHESSVATNPKFAHILSGTIADERRHVGFGENRIGSLIQQHPERKADVEKLQKDMTYHMLATFGSQFTQGPSPEEVDKIMAKRGVEHSEAEWQGVKLNRASTEELEAVLSDTILKEFKVRLGRIGIEYQSPARP
ncbi:MAG: ferritin-like domain-containing protein [bacterium]|nr:ferritin-like domain-containing protein [bacterium]MCP5065211.1 ferritin-like domain-containing protein [bacterium]